MYLLFPEVTDHVLSPFLSITLFVRFLRVYSSSFYILMMMVCVANIVFQFVIYLFLY